MSRVQINDLRRTETANQICAGDCCIDAVRRAYAGMLALRQPEAAAFDAALQVFAWHHPEVMPDDAATLVRGWVCEGMVH